MNGFLRKWKEYFEVNAALPDGIPWSARERLPEEEMRWLGPSLAAFQLGESSDGKGLQAAAEACARERGWEALGAVTRWFIREERNHADLLGRFLDLHGFPRLRREWTDQIFRILRRGMGLRHILPVLLTAEILSLVYYRAVAASTRNGMLKALCRKILADEMAHVAYESVLLGVLRKGLPDLRGGLEFQAHRLLYALTLRVVYLRHRQVLKRGGYPYGLFRRAVWAEFDRVMDPKVLAAPAIPEPGSWEEGEDDGEAAVVTLRWESVHGMGAT